MEERREGGQDVFVREMRSLASDGRRHCARGSPPPPRNSGQARYLDVNHRPTASKTSRTWCAELGTEKPFFKTRCSTNICFTVPETCHGNLNARYSTVIRELSVSGDLMAARIVNILSSNHIPHRISNLEALKTQVPLPFVHHALSVHSLLGFGCLNVPLIAE